nr:MAG TPA: hypothetical protein [Caudoviricetes sp.]
MTISHSFCRVAQNDQRSQVTIGHFAPLTLTRICIIINTVSTTVNLCMCGIQIVYIIIRKDVLKWASLIPIKR